MSARPGLLLGKLACLAFALTSACGGPAPATLKPVESTPTAKATAGDAWRAQTPPPGPSQAFQYPLTETLTLTNGLQLFALEWQAPTVSLRVSCRRAVDPVGKAGLSSLTARMLTEGTTHKSSLELALAAESMGTSLGHDVGHDSVSFDLMVLPEHTERGLTLLAEVLREPAFRQADFERVKKERLDDIALQRQNPQSLAWLIGYQALLGPIHGRSRSGTPEQVANIELGDLRDYHQSFWGPGHCAVLAAGPLKLGQFAHLAGAAFGDWRPARRSGTTAASAMQSTDSEHPAAVPSGTDSANRLLFFDRPGDVQTAVWVGLDFPKREAQGYEQRQLMNSLFGGLFTSRLNMNLREKNAYTYGAFSAILATRQYGAFIVSTNVKTETTVPALKEIFTELDKLRAANSISATELSRSRTDRIFSAAARLEHTDSILSGLEDQFVYQLPLDYFAELPAHLSKLQPHDVWQQTQRLPGNGYTIVIVGDRTQLGDLAGFAPESQAVDLAWLQ